MKHLLTSTIIAALVILGLVFSSPLTASQVNEVGVYSGYSYSSAQSEPVQVLPEDTIGGQRTEILPLEETISLSYQGAVIHASLVEKGIDVEHNSRWRDVHMSAVHYLGGDNITEWQVEVEPVEKEVSDG